MSDQIKKSSSCSHLIIRISTAMSQLDDVKQEGDEVEYIYRDDGDDDAQIHPQVRLHFQQLLIGERALTRFSPQHWHSIWLPLRSPSRFVLTLFRSFKSE